METRPALADWASVDSSWGSCLSAYTVGDQPELGTLTPEHAARRWQTVETWTDAYATSESVVQTGRSRTIVGNERLAATWESITPWWNSYTDTGHETARQLAATLAGSTAEWVAADGPFEADPPASDLTRSPVSRGPVQPGTEVEWSRWLAQLLCPSAALVRALFAGQVTQPLEEVTREDRLPRETGGFRRADLVVQQAAQGVSIEIKLDDPNCERTAETAALVEEKYEHREWEHVLLLPARHRKRLERIVTGQSRRQPTVQSKSCDESRDRSKCCAGAMSPAPCSRCSGAARSSTTTRHRTHTCSVRCSNSSCSGSDRVQRSNGWHSRQMSSIRSVPSR